MPDPVYEDSIGVAGLGLGSDRIRRRARGIVGALMIKGAYFLR